ncbi:MULTISPECIES: hypothetical protein [unclassified Streptomyces]|uniref:hypothetical protein n=1 Tax=unclassified Streptomyces TaxID=2593676 RepID=UPI002366FB24|nr:MULTISPECIES: hypothetical protein [unclassified Streptomyces]MDF3147081.1 hypothetical protein [Streptomyces sp. T21Q-yed]WDF43530.1 hypothetical protein PBV52_45520 [Streptomyces sp. T12]
MRKLKRSTATALILAALAGTTALATAAPATAAGYQCKTSSDSVDDPSYTGPDSDNWDLEVTLCAMRSGGYIYTNATVYWDGPYTAKNRNTYTFNNAKFQLQTKRSVRGTDPVVKSAAYNGLEYALEHSSMHGNGSYSTGTLKHKAGSGSRYLADGYIQLDWSGDGKGYLKPILFTASPVV